MSRQDYWVLIDAVDAEEAKDEVQCWIDNQLERNAYFDYAELDNTDGYVPIKPLAELHEELTEQLHVAMLKLSEHIKLFDKYKQQYAVGHAPSKDAMGYQAQSIAQLACEDFCYDMPFYNINYEIEGYNLPDKLDGWYAVKVRCHY